VGTQDHRAPAISRTWTISQLHDEASGACHMARHETEGTIIHNFLTVGRGSSRDAHAGMPVILDQRVVHEQIACWSGWEDAWMRAVVLSSSILTAVISQGRVVSWPSATDCGPFYD